MNELERLQKLFRDIMAKLKVIRAIKPEDLTDENRTERNFLLTEIETVTRDIDDEKKAIELENRDQFSNNDDDLGGASVTVKDQPIYRSAFPLGQQMQDIVAVTARRGDVAAAESRLEQVANRMNTQLRAVGDGMVEKVDSLGGFLLQGESSIDLMTRGFNNSEVLKRCDKRTTSKQSVEIVGIDETSRVTGSRGGGVRVYTDEELDQMTSSKTKFARIKIEPKRLTGLYHASEELLSDAPMLEGEMASLFGKEFAFKAQDLVIRGTGSGQAQGILTANCLITVPKDSGQGAKTIISQNILDMRARIAGMKKDLVWLTNRDCYPQLPLLSVPIGTGGALVPLYDPKWNKGDGGGEAIGGIPMVEIEQCSTLGTKGDIFLVDFSQYICADKGTISSANSIHLKFDYNQTTFRFIYQFDGQPRWKSALTPYKGSATTSPMVTLAART